VYTRGVIFSPHSSSGPQDPQAWYLDWISVNMVTTSPPQNAHIQTDLRTSHDFITFTKWKNTQKFVFAQSQVMNNLKSHYLKANGSLT
jgi:hypothetical protein